MIKQFDMIVNGWNLDVRIFFKNGELEGEIQAEIQILTDSSKESSCLEASINFSLIP